MALYTISDLHLPLGVDKPMDVFGKSWENYVERLEQNWQSVVKEEDVVVLPGDFSWAMYLKESLADFTFLHRLNGIKILAKGNHDYWWETQSKLKGFLTEQGFSDIYFLQNNCYLYGNTAICGTRGWNPPSPGHASEEDEKIYNREVLRLALSLEEAKKRGAEEIIVFTHYPPLSGGYPENAFVNMMQKYGVMRCYYGHIHAAGKQHAVNGTVNGITYRLVSCDYVDFTPVLVMAEKKDFLNPLI